MEFPRSSRRKEMSTRIENGKKRESVTRLAWNLGGRGWQGAVWQSRQERSKPLGVGGQGSREQLGGQPPSLTA